MTYGPLFVPAMNADGTHLRRVTQQTYRHVDAPNRNVSPGRDS